MYLRRFVSEKFVQVSKSYFAHAYIGTHTHIAGDHVTLQVDVRRMYVVPDVSACGDSCTRNPVCPVRLYLSCFNDNRSRV